MQHSRCNHVNTEAANALCESFTQKEQPESYIAQHIRAEKARHEVKSRIDRRYDEEGR